jgi:hypothetical protein
MESFSASRVEVQFLGRNQSLPMLGLFLPPPHNFDQELKIEMAAAHHEGALLTNQLQSSCPPLLTVGPAHSVPQHRHEQ